MGGVEVPHIVTVSFTNSVTIAVLSSMSVTLGSIQSISHPYTSLAVKQVKYHNTFYYFSGNSKNDPSQV